MRPRNTPDQKDLSYHPNHSRINFLICSINQLFKFIKSLIQIKIDIFYIFLCFPF